MYFQQPAFVVSKVDKLVPNEFNVDNTFKPEIFNDPFIFVVLFNVVKPLTLNDDNIVVLFNVVKPLIFNDEINETLLSTNCSFKFEDPLTFKLE
jgi:hypothetical protein